MFVKFYEIPSLPFQDIEKPKRRGWTNRRTNNVKTVYPPPNSVCGGHNYWKTKFKNHSLSETDKVGTLYLVIIKG